MLIGSQATGNVGPLSDVDIAVWHDPNLDSRARFDLQLGLVGDAARALGTDEVDVVLLNHAPPLMRHAPSATARGWSSVTMVSESAWRPVRSSTISTPPRCALSSAVACGDG